MPIFLEELQPGRYVTVRMRKANFARVPTNVRILLLIRSMLSKSKLKLVQSLKQKKFRQKYKLFVAEGEKIFNTILSQERYLIDSVFCTDAFHDSGQTPTNKTEIVRVTEREMGQLSHLKSNPEVLMLLQIPEQNVDLSIYSRMIYLDGLQDPGNMGTVIRTADWFGAEAVIRSEESADFYSPKVVQSTMGSFANVDLITLSPSNLLGEAERISLYASAMEASIPLKQVKREFPACLVIGNEGRGIQQEILDSSKYLLKIPGSSGRIADSLNASVATGILCQHLFSE